MENTARTRIFLPFISNIERSEQLKSTTSLIEQIKLQFKFIFNYSFNLVPKLKIVKSLKYLKKVLDSRTIYLKIVVNTTRDHQ